MPTYTHADQLLPLVAVLAFELLILLALGGALHLIARAALRRLDLLRPGRDGELVKAVLPSVRNVVALTFGVLALAVSCYDGWLFWSGVDVRQHTWDLLATFPAATWQKAGIALGEIALAAVGIVIATRLLRRGLHAAESRINGWDKLADNNHSLTRFFAGLDQTLVNTAWLLLAALASRLLALPDAVDDVVLGLTYIYVVVAVGFLVIRAVSLVVATLEGLSRNYASSRDWLRYYEQLKPLVPLFRRCLEYALWIGIGSLVLAELSPIAWLAQYGPDLMQAIGIYFLGRVAIEVGRLLISLAMLDETGLDDLERRRRSTIVPLVRSIFQYLCYFAMFVLILKALEFDPAPFLAGAGALGVVIGFGAQSMIGDVVSGFFILFENVYLVGDVIDGGGASGVVETIEFRVTRIRDGSGRLHIIRNGDMKEVINYSKDYVMAVVDVDISYGADVRKVFEILTAAGERLRAECPDVLAATTIEGINGFGQMGMTIRTSTRVKPGKHEPVGAQLRLILKDAFDQSAQGKPRYSLVP